jgi:hypothetical protein
MDCRSVVWRTVGIRILFVLTVLILVRPGGAAAAEQPDEAVAAISTSPVLQKRDVPFAIGQVKGDLDCVKTQWGIRSLPWLILTDSEHVVRAEGFSLDELEERVKQIGGE